MRESVASAYAAVLDRGMVVPYNPHPVLLDDFIVKCVGEDLAAAPDPGGLTAKAFPSPWIAAGDDDDALTQHGAHVLKAAGADRSVRYAKVTDTAGNVAWANPDFPMTVDLQACAYYREVYVTTLLGSARLHGGRARWPARGPPPI